MNRYLKSLMGFSIGPLIGAIFGFITIPIITYFISPSEYGRVSMFTLAQTILGMIVYLGMDQAYIKFFTSTDEKDTLLINSTIPPFGLVVFISILVITFNKSISLWLFDTEEELLCVLCLVLYLPFSVIERFGTITLRVKEKVLQFSVFSVIVKALTLVFSVTFLVFIGRDYRSIIYATVAAQIVGSSIIGIYTFKKLDIKRIKLDKSIIEKMLRFGIPLVPATIVGWVLNSMDKIMIRNICDYEQLGLYSAALKIVAILMILQSCFSNFWTPIAFRWDKENKSIKQFDFVGNLLSFVLVSVFIMIMLFKNIIISILSPEYRAAVNIVPFLVLYPIMYTLSEVTVVGVYFTGKSGFTIVVALISCIVNLVLNSVFIPRWGAIGASVATGLSYIVFFWVRTLVSWRIWKRMNLSRYAMYTIFLLIICGFNLVASKYIVLLNTCAMMLIILLNIPLIKKATIMLRYGNR